MELLTGNRVMKLTGSAYFKLFPVLRMNCSWIWCKISQWGISCWIFMYPEKKATITQTWVLLHTTRVLLWSQAETEKPTVYLSLAPPSPLSFTNILPLTSGPLADSSSCVVCVYKRGGLGFEVGQVSGSSHCVNLIISRFWAWLCFTVITTAWFRSSKSAPSQWCLFANIRNLEGLTVFLI